MLGARALSRNGCTKNLFRLAAVARATVAMSGDLLGEMCGENHVVAAKLLGTMPQGELNNMSTTPAFSETWLCEL